MGMEWTPNKSQHTKLTLEKKILLPLLPGFNSQPFDHQSGTLTNKLPQSKETNDNGELDVPLHTSTSYTVSSVTEQMIMES